MMQCPTCGAILPQDSFLCSSCGTPLTDMQSSMPLVENGNASSYMAAAPSSVVTRQLDANEAPKPLIAHPLTSGKSYLESGRTEFSGIQAPAGAPANVGSIYPPVVPEPASAIASSNNLPVPGSLPPVLPVPGRQGRTLVRSLISIVLALLFFSSGVLIGIHIGQGSVVSARTATNSTTSLSSDPGQLYQQVMSRPPTFVDTLQDATLSSWSVYEKPTYGCEVKSDGLHVHIKDVEHFSYCTSGRGKFSNFALQIDMKMLSGDGGGLILRADTVGGNYYYFHICPNGGYVLRIGQNHESGPDFSQGTISAFNNGYIGVTASDSDSPAEVVYTNARIWNL